MNVSLTPELKHSVDERVRTGRYASASEVIREALRLLELQEVARQRRLESVRQKIDRGLTQLEDGKGIGPEECDRGFEADADDSASPMRRYEISPEAVDNRIRIREFVAADSPDAAPRSMAKIRPFHG